MPDNRMDKLRLDLPPLLINSSANLCLWTSAHAQKINMTVSIVTDVNCTCGLFFRENCQAG